MSFKVDHLRLKWERACRFHGENHADTLSALRDYLRAIRQATPLGGETSEEDLAKFAEPLQRYLRGVRETRNGWEKDAEILEWILYLSVIRYWQKRYQEAEVLAERSAALMSRALGENHERTYNALFFLARVLRALEKWPEELEVNRRIYKNVVSRESDTHPDATEAMRDLVLNLYRQRKYGEAARWARRELDARIKRDGFAVKQTWVAEENLCACLREDGRTEEEIEIRRDQVFRARFEGKRSPGEILDAEEKLLACLKRHSGIGVKGKFYSEYALRTACEILQLRKRMGPEGADRLPEAAAEVRSCYEKLGRYREALAVQENLLRIRREREGDSNAAVLDEGIVLAELLFRCGQTEQAAKEIEALLPILLKEPGEHGRRILRLRVLQQWMQEGETE